MIDSFVDKAWSCFNKLTSEKNPPDKRRKSKESGRPTINWMCSPEDRFDGASSSGYPGSEYGISYLNLDPAKLPDPEKLEMAFAQLLEELDLSTEKQKQLAEQTAEKKWLMIIEQSNRRDKLQNKQSCSSIISKLIEFSQNFPEKFDWPLLTQALEALSISLRTESFSFVQEFLDLGGIELLVCLLNEARRREAGKIAFPILTALRALLNSTTARAIVLENKEVLFAITASLDICYYRTKIVTLEILSGLCLTPEGGHRAVLEALTEARKLLGERTRFQRLVDDLHREHGSSDRDSERVRVALMSLVNALFRSGPAEHSLEFRIHLRCELLMLGIQEAIDCLRDTHGSALEDHFDLFEMMRQEDEQEMASSIDSGASSPVELDSPVGLAEALGRRLDKTTALPHLISLLQHLLMVPGNEKYAPLWKLFDVILQQLSLQTSMGPLATDADPQFSIQPLKFDMDEVLSRLRTQQEYDKLEKEYHQLQTELDNERKRVLELENRIADIQDGVSLSSYSRNSETSSNPSDPCQTPPLAPSVSSIPQVKPPMPPPLPPPSVASLKAGGKLNLNQNKTKNVPKPMQPLKVLNWKKIPANKIPGTIWEKMDDEKLYKSIDLAHFGHCFASGKEHENSMTLRRIKEPTTVSVLEARRAQNCTIMLSKLKLNYKEIKMAVMSMDEKGKIPKDMIEQMLKYIPTSDELMLLSEVVEKHGNASVLALGDRYFYEVGKIPRYEQRLRCLNAIRGFQERIDELTLYVNAVSKASSTIQSSKKLKQLFGLILALGNYLNHSKHNGDASGFAIESLHLIPDVKNSLRPETNLLHYIVELLEQKFPDIMKLRKDLSPVYEAAKYNKSEMEIELRSIEATLKEVSQELATQKTAKGLESCVVDPMSPEPNRKSKSDIDLKKIDKFVEVVGTFLGSAKRQFAELEKINKDMVKKFTDCVVFFAEDAMTASPDSFFGIFSRFLSQFAECQHYLWEVKEEEERIKRQTIAKSFVKKGRRSKGGGGDGREFERLIDAIQSGDIFSDDLTRLRTSFRIPKKNAK